MISIILLNGLTFLNTSYEDAQKVVAIEDQENFKIVHLFAIVLLPQGKKISIHDFFRFKIIVSFMTKRKNVDWIH